MTANLTIDALHQSHFNFNSLLLITAELEEQLRVELSDHHEALSACERIVDELKETLARHEQHLLAKVHTVMLDLHEHLHSAKREARPDHPTTSLQARLDEATKRYESLLQLVLQLTGGDNDINDVQTSQKPARRYNSLAIASPHDHHISVYTWPLENGMKRSPRVVLLRGHTAPITSMCMITETSLASVSLDNTLRVWEVASGRCLRSLHMETGGGGVLVKIDHNRVATGSRLSDATLRVWNIHNGECVRTMTRGRPPPYSSNEGGGGVSALMSVSSLGMLASGSFDWSITLWDVETGESRGSLLGHVGAVLALEMLDERMLASASADHTLTLWNVHTRERLQTLVGHWHPVTSLVCVSSTQNAVARLASGASNGNVKIWHLDTGREQTFDADGGGRVNALAIMSADEVASASEDGSVRVWNVTSGECVDTFKLLADGIRRTSSYIESKMIFLNL